MDLATSVKAEKFSFKTQQWSDISDMPFENSFCSSVFIKNILIVGYYSGFPVKYNIGKDTYKTLLNNLILNSHKIVLFDGEKVFILSQNFLYFAKFNNLEQVTYSLSGLRLNEPPITKPVFFKSSFYWISASYQLYRFDNSSKNLSIVPIDLTSEKKDLKIENK